MTKTKSLYIFPVAFNPWIYFFIFLISNGLLSYFSLPLEMKFWVGLMGVILPLGLALASYRSESEPVKPLYSREFLPSIPPWVWAAVGLLAILVRFYKLTTLSVWPHFDEGYLNYFAFEFSRKWDGRIIYGYNQTTPIYIWCLGFLFKLVPPSLGVIWFFPAFLSVLSIPIGYMACRRFFSKSFSFVVVSLFALGFWSFFMARFSFGASMNLLWECFVFFLWGAWATASSSQSRRKWLILLGMSVGFGFYINIIGWLPFSSLIGLTFLYMLFQKRRGLLDFFLLFLGALLMTYVPYPCLFAVFRQGFGLYFHDIWSVSSTQSFPTING